MIAAAGVDAHRHACRPPRQGIVEQPNIGLVQLLLRAGQGVDLFAILRIRKRCEHRVVDLEIRATKPVQGAKFVDIDLGKIVPEIFGIGVDAFVLERRAQAVQHAW